jgi:hypothetical protein
LFLRGGAAKPNEAPDEWIVEPTRPGALKVLKSGDGKYFDAKDTYHL